MKIKPLKERKYRVGRLELSTCDERLLTKDVEHRTMEICQWAENNSHRWSVAHWMYHDEGYYLKFTGDRFLRCDQIDFMVLMKMGQKVLNDHFNDYYEYKYDEE